MASASPRSSPTAGAFQNEVSERLAEQVLHALYELLRGVQAADDASHSELLREPLAERPDDVYHALLTVILRLVFLLYAEERDLLPEGETFARHYSIAGLCERLREDAALHPGHDEPALRRMGAAPRAIPAVSTTGRRRTGCICRSGTATSSIPTGFRSSKAVAPAERASFTSGSSRRWFPTARSTVCSTSCWCSTGSGSPIAPSTWSRSAQCTRR